MGKSTPSLMALLGLVAFAGYQNRNRIPAMLNNARAKGSSGADGGLLSDLAASFNQGSAGGGGIAGGVSEVVERFRSAGRGRAADSWVSADRPNESIGPGDLEHALGAETVDEIARKTGLSRSEVLNRLATALPETVNRLIPTAPVCDSLGIPLRSLM